MAITIHKKPIAMFLQAEAAPYHRKIHCMMCGLWLLDITGTITMLVDNSGPTAEQLSPNEFGYTEIKCHRSACHQKYRIFMPASAPVPVVRVNGQILQ